MRRSLAGSVVALIVLPIAVAVPLALVLSAKLNDAWLAGLLTLLATLIVVVLLVRRGLRPMLSLFRALAGTIESYRDGDFSFGLRWPRQDELGDLVAAHNALGQVLREQRLALVQRELLLDTMVQHTPVAMTLIDDGGHIVFANLAARRLLNRGRKLEGWALPAVLNICAAPLREALQRGGDGLFAVPVADAAAGEEDEDTYHLARRKFRLNGRPHELILLRQLTTELRRQEVQTWKKVIRVISHELNNSLAPIASLAHSGAELQRRQQTERLPEVFATIEERARHLEAFIRGYARFAKLPSPRLQAVAWDKLLERLGSQIEFKLEGELPDQPLQADQPQIEQALLNLVKNAHESGSAPDQIGLRISRSVGRLRIDVLDRGSGMNEAVMQNALMPFYSTKRSGSGLGLALAREIAEAHGGSIALSNREGGGLCVSLLLPE